MPPSVMFCVSIQAHLSAFSLPVASFQQQGRQRRIPAGAK